MKKVFITGISGTGKSTVLNELKKKGVYTISLDETPNLCAWFSKKTGKRPEQKSELNIEFTEAHDWLCDTSYLKKLMNVDKDLVVVAGITSNQDEFLNLFDEILLLDANPEIFLARINSRKDNPFGKDPNIQKKLVAGSENFKNRMISKGAISIDANKSINEVVKQVSAILGV